VLFTKVIVPAGVTVTTHPGTGQGKTFTGNNDFGFRPGYRYRLQLSNLPGKPGASLFPVVEVYGSLVPRPGLNYWEFPAPVAFSETDLARAAAGDHIIKIVYLEDPKKAIPTAAAPDKPIELNEDTTELAIKTARENGRVVAVVTLGDRTPDAAELNALAVGNTILHPGEQALAAPAGMPHFGWDGIALFDPVIGPKPPVEECLTDGGDKGDRLGLNAMGRIAGLNPTDVGVEYSVNGKRKVTTSNEVCVCSPRFVVRKAAVAANGLTANKVIDGASQTVGRQKREGERSRRQEPAHDPGGQHRHACLRRAHEGRRRVRPPRHARGRLLARPGRADQHEPLHRDEVRGPEARRATGRRRHLHDPLREPHERTGHGPGRERQPQRPPGVVPGSAATDRTSNVTTTPNEAGSVTVRFELPGTLAPGETGTVTFKAKVR
jgi:hypothetical protein